MHNPNVPQTLPSDEQLVAQVARRDTAAFSHLYDRYSKSIYALAVYSVGAADAEEVVQDVFIRLWDRAGQFDPRRGSFAAWFMTIARNHIRDRLRGHSQQQRLIAVETIEHLIAEGSGPRELEDESWQEAQAQLLLRALQNLPDEQRKAVILAYFGDMSQSAIARHLDWPLGTVKKRIRLGLQKLRASLMGKETPADPESKPIETRASDHHEL